MLYFQDGNHGMLRLRADSAIEVTSHTEGERYIPGRGWAARDHLSAVALYGGDYTSITPHQVAAAQAAVDAWYVK